MSKMIFKNDLTGQVKEAPTGFSWTTLFFGAFVPLTRGDFKWAIIMVLANMFTFYVSSFVFPFIYNNLYIKDLHAQGFRPVEQP